MSTVKKIFMGIFILVALIFIATILPIWKDYDGSRVSFWSLSMPQPD